MMDSQETQGFTKQINARLDPEAWRNLRAIAEVTHEDYSKILRRLLREEYGRRVLGLVLEMSAIEAERAARRDE
jgi:hypothetical protein